MSDTTLPQPNAGGGAAPQPERMPEAEHHAWLKANWRPVETDISTVLLGENRHHWRTMADNHPDVEKPWLEGGRKMNPVLAALVEDFAHFWHRHHRGIPRPAQGPLVRQLARKFVGKHFPRLPMKVNGADGATADAILKFMESTGRIAPAKQPDWRPNETIPEDYYQRRTYPLHYADTALPQPGATPGGGGGAPERMPEAEHHKWLRNNYGFVARSIKHRLDSNGHSAIHDLPEVAKPWLPADFKVNPLIAGMVEDFAHEWHRRTMSGTRPSEGHHGLVKELVDRHFPQLEHGRFRPHSEDATAAYILKFMESTGRIAPAEQPDWRPNETIPEDYYQRRSRPLHYADTAQPQPGAAQPAGPHPEHVAAAKSLVKVHSEGLATQKEAHRDHVEALHERIGESPHLASWLAHHAPGLRAGTAKGNRIHPTNDEKTGKFAGYALGGQHVRDLHDFMRESDHYPHLLEHLRPEVEPRHLADILDTHHENVARIPTIPVKNPDEFGKIIYNRSVALESIPIPLRGERARKYPPLPGDPVHFVGPDGRLILHGRVKSVEGGQAHIHGLTEKLHAPHLGAYTAGYHGAHDEVSEHAKDDAGEPLTLRELEDRIAEWTAKNEEIKRKGGVGYHRHPMQIQSAEAEADKLRNLASLGPVQARYHMLGRWDAQHFRPLGHSVPDPSFASEDPHGDWLKQWRYAARGIGGDVESMIEREMEKRSINKHVLMGTHPEAQMIGYHGFPDHLAGKAAEDWLDHLKQNPTARRSDLQAVIGRMLDNLPRRDRSPQQQQYARPDRPLLYARPGTPTSPRPLLPDVPRQGPTAVSPASGGSFAKKGKGFVHPSLAKPPEGAVKLPQGPPGTRPGLMNRPAAAGQGGKPNLGQMFAQMLPEQLLQFLESIGLTLSDEQRQHLAGSGRGKPQMYAREEGGTVPSQGKPKALGGSKPASGQTSDPARPMIARGQLGQHLAGGKANLAHVFGGGFDWGTSTVGDWAAMSDHLDALPDREFWHAMHAGAQGLRAQGEAAPPQMRRLFHRAMAQRKPGPEHPPTHKTASRAAVLVPGQMDDDRQRELAALTRGLPKIAGIPGSVYTPAGLDLEALLGAELPVKTRMLHEEELNPPLSWQKPLPAAAELQTHTWKKRKQDSVNPTFQVSGPTGEFFGKKPADMVEVGSEVAASHILRLIGVPNVPAVASVPDPKLKLKAGPNKGKPRPVLVSQRVPGKDAADTYATDRAHWERMMRETPPEHLAAMAFGNWLINANDRHDSNYMVTPDAKLVPIDYGQSFYPHSSNDLGWGRPHGNTDMLTEGSFAVTAPLIRPDTPISKELIQRTLQHRDEIRKMVEQQVVPHFAGTKNHPDPYHRKDRRANVLAVLDDKFAMLERLAKEERPTLADLPPDQSHKLYQGPDR